MFKYGKKPARPGAIKMMYRDYAGTNPPPAPEEFGHEALVQTYHMLGNDLYGDCLFAGAAHETYLWTAEGSERARITTHDVLSDYAAATGFNPNDPSTDQGTDMQVGASYRLKTGIVDALGNRHKIGAYVSIKAGDIAEHQQAAWLFSSVGLGLTVGENQQDQFNNGQPWDGDPGANAGGHYVPLVAFRGGLFWVVTWGKVHPITPAFLETQNDESICYLSPDFFKDGKSPEGFDVAALQADQADLMRG